jgi:hypothetical protein
MVMMVVMMMMKDVGNKSREIANCCIIQQQQTISETPLWVNGKITFATVDLPTTTTTCGNRLESLLTLESSCFLLCVD